MAYGSVIDPNGLTEEVTRLAKMVLAKGFSQSQVTAALNQAVANLPALNVNANDT